MDNELLTSKIAAATAHRACHSAEHDPAHGRLHGFCIVCGIPWPCETAKTFIFEGDEADRSLNAEKEADKEKTRRVYYQSIVYGVCNLIDRHLGNKPGGGVVCGTVDSPSNEVEEKLSKILSL